MKTFFQLREETSGRTITVSQEVFEAAQQMMNEETEHEFGYQNKSMNAAKKGVASAHKAGLKINHHSGRNAHGNTPGSKPHKKPDISVHYEYGEDEPNGVTLHTSAAKKHESAKHFAKAEEHGKNEKWDD